MTFEQLAKCRLWLLLLLLLLLLHRPSLSSQPINDRQSSMAASHYPQITGRCAQRASRQRSRMKRKGKMDWC